MLGQRKNSRVYDIIQLALQWCSFGPFGFLCHFDSAIIANTVKIRNNDPIWCNNFIVISYLNQNRRGDSITINAILL